MSHYELWILHTNERVSAFNSPPITDHSLHYSYSLIQLLRLDGHPRRSYRLPLNPSVPPLRSIILIVTAARCHLAREPGAVSRLDNPRRRDGLSFFASGVSRRHTLRLRVLGCGGRCARVTRAHAKWSTRVARTRRLSAWVADATGVRDSRIGRRFRRSSSPLSLRNASDAWRSLGGVPLSRPSFCSSSQSPFSSRAVSFRRLHRSSLRSRPTRPACALFISVLQSRGFLFFLRIRARPPHASPAAHARREVLPKMSPEFRGIVPALATRELPRVNCEMPLRSAVRASTQEDWAPLAEYTLVAALFGEARVQTYFGERRACCRDKSTAPSMWRFDVMTRSPLFP